MVKAGGELGVEGEGGSEPEWEKESSSVGREGTALNEGLALIYKPIFIDS